jgi:hypothetical protein
MFSKNNQISNFIKISPVGAELFHADGHDEANSRFSQFCEKRLNIRTTIQLCRFYLAEIDLCVLQVRVGSLQSPHDGRIVIMSG